MAQEAKGFSKMAPPFGFPPGEVVRGFSGQEWVIGSSIGRGGCGEVYCAARKGEDKFNYAIKMVRNVPGFMFCIDNII